ncbi:MAG: glucose-6-phosphate isomerase, partial [Acidimicrobiales bacterium]|nr:glucose-6-phosphate isomerase [Acidimicrobiales bacterium]
LEPNVLYAYANSKVNDPKRFVAITDPDTALDHLAVSERFGRVFRNRSDIGGRYSVLSYFGLVPAALAGYDLDEFLSSAKNLNYQEAVALGVELGNAVLAKKDKITLKVSEPFRWVGLWLEQLLAESTGKNLTGCIPVPTQENEDSKDRFHVDVSIDSPLDLAGLFLKFEVATSIAGHILDIDPFNEPNVAESKANTNRVLEELPLPTLPTLSASELYPWLESSLNEGDYISIQAYLPFGQDDKLEKLRRHVRDKFNSIAVTAGYGPRFLHSTGQLHKGGPNSVVCVQLVDKTPPPPLNIPGKDYDFATLIAAQSIGDYESLQAHSRRIIRIGIEDINELII